MVNALALQRAQVRDRGGSVPSSELSVAERLTDLAENTEFEKLITESGT